MQVSIHHHQRVQMNEVTLQGVLHFFLNEDPIQIFEDGMDVKIKIDVKIFLPVAK